MKVKWNLSIHEICRPFGECSPLKYPVKDSGEFKKKKSHFKIFNPNQIQSIAHHEYSCKILSAWFYTATNAHLALLAHVATHNMKAVSDTFTRRNVSPRPLNKPNMNANRSHNMLRPLRSPPPAANWNRASSTALCAACSYCSDNPSDASSVYCVSNV